MACSSTPGGVVAWKAGEGFVVERQRIQVWQDSDCRDKVDIGIVVGEGMSEKRIMGWKCSQRRGCGGVDDVRGEDYSVYGISSAYGGREGAMAAAIGPPRPRSCPWIAAVGGDICARSAVAAFCAETRTNELH